MHEMTKVFTKRNGAFRTNLDKDRTSAMGLGTFESIKAYTQPMAAPESVMIVR